MADEETPPGPAPDGTADERITALEHGQVTISGKLDQLLGMFNRDDAPAQGEPEAERPEITLAREIRDGIVALAKGKPAEQPAVKPAELAEKPPKTPVRRVTKAIWGDDE